MALIDQTYFEGPLKVANLDQPHIEERFLLFLQKYELELLEDVLGLDLYAAFSAGLQNDPVEDRWINLLYGTTYTDRYGRNVKYSGLINVSQPINAGVYLPQDITFTVDADLALAGVYVNQYLVNKTYRVIQRGVGPLVVDDEYSLNGDGFSKVFTLGEVYTLQFTQPVPLPLSDGTPSAELKQSFIANYVYYKYQADSVTVSAGVGESVQKAENGKAVVPVYKLIQAWNEMSNQIAGLWKYLYTNREVYAWDDYTFYFDSAYGHGWLWNSGPYQYRNKYAKINSLGI